MDTDEAFCYHRIAFKQAPHISKLIRNYLSGEIPKSLYSQSPNLKGLLAQAAIKKKHFSYRTELNKALKRQYQRCLFDKVEGQNVLENIDLLSKENTLTITTGHQACLGGGPLYTFYKIISAISTCKKLNQLDPKNQYVPIFWMATEDHDWEEAKHFFFEEEKWVYDQEVNGPVGRVSTEGMKEWLKTFAAHLPPGQVTNEIIEHLEHAYLKHNNWADATRQWAHDLFGQHGLVIIDGDDPELKKLFARVMLAECTQSFAKSDTIHCSNILEENGFQVQVHPAQINIFYMGDGARTYVERTTSGYNLNGLSVKEEELQQILEERPQDFSPNVVMRPLYQEWILPNIAYFGGPGELAYWFQLSDIFRRFSTPFPVLLLRHGFALLEEKNQQRYEKLNTPLFDLSPKIWKETWVKKHTQVRLHLDEEKTKIDRIFSDLEQLAGQTDGSMMGAVRAQRAKQMKGLNKLEKKLMRAEKRFHVESMNQIEVLSQSLYPTGIPQERHDSLWQWWSAIGKNPLEMIINIADTDAPPEDFVYITLKTNS